MEITMQNKERYIRRVLIYALKKCYLNWLGKFSSKNFFILEEVVNLNSREKMNIIKNYIYELCYSHKNVWYVYKEIEYFRDIKDLLCYISPKYCYNPETVLLQILREDKNFYIKNSDEVEIYFISSGVKEELKNLNDLNTIIKTFIRYYTKLLLDIKKKPYSIQQLYFMLVNKELSYDSPRNGDIILKIMNHNHKNIEEILELCSDGLKSAREIYYEIISKDSNHFYKIIDDYYGSKDWDEELKFKGYLKLFDQYLYKKEYEKAKELGEKSLETLDSSGLSDRKKERVQKLIEKNMKGW